RAAGAQPPSSLCIWWSLRTWGVTARRLRPMPAGGNPRPRLVGSWRTQLETGTAEELMTTVDYNAFTRQLMAEIRENGRPTSGPMAGRPLMILTTKGAKSGEPRSAVVTYSRDG